jgi:L-aminopeptidase/D-esterase-like protein
VGKLFGRPSSEAGGQGAAFLETPSGYRMLAVTIVNALGNITDFDGTILHGSREPGTGKRRSAVEAYITPSIREKLSTSASAPTSGNTTISALITDAPLERLDLQRIAIMAHSAMARVIEPFHTPYDGDALFAVSVPMEVQNGARDHTPPPPEGAERILELGTLGGRVLCEAVLSAFQD